MASRKGWNSVVLACALACGAGVAAAWSEHKPAKVELESVALGLVRADPLAYLGRDLKLRFQVEHEPQDWNPFVTRFGSGEFRAVVAWADEQLLWNQDAWNDPAALLFARRGSIADKVLEDAPKLARFECIGHVREVFLGRAWIEVDHVQRISGAIGEGSILHATRALEHLEAQQWQLAADNFDRALVGEMPAAARTELRRLRESCAPHLHER